MGIDSQKPEQSTLIIQKGFTPEPRFETHLLTENNVNEIYYQATRFDSLDTEKKFVNNILVEEPEIFNPAVLKKIEDKIIVYANQLPENLFKGLIGDNVKFANYDRNTNPSDIEKAIKKYSILTSAWTKDNQVRNKLLSLIMAIGYGRFTTSRAELIARPSTPICFLIDKDRYHQLLGK